ncbi:hypothetical protein CFOL_v3_35650, partial [Cephalotus follicularis]
RFACNVKELGLWGDDRRLVPEQCFVDLQIAKSLMSLEVLQENHRGVGINDSQRAEIEALYLHGFDYLGKHIAKKIVQANHI